MMEFKYLDFIVTGCPRSGTQYAARALKRLGFSCEHEVCFNPWKITFAEGRADGKIWGDSSWLAVPFLSWLPTETRVIHLVRDPVRTIDSMLGTGQLDWPTDYRRFLVHHACGHADYWPEDVVGFAQQIWVDWNERIEANGNIAMRIRIEEFENSLPALLAVLAPGRKLTEADLSGLDQVPKNENSRPFDGDNRLHAGYMTDRTREMAIRYGYRY